jgi:hypothetical protein
VKGYDITQLFYIYCYSTAQQLLYALNSFQATEQQQHYKELVKNSGGHKLFHAL